MSAVDHLPGRYGAVAAVGGLSCEVRRLSAGRAIGGKSGGVSRRVWYR